MDLKKENQILSEILESLVIKYDSNLKQCGIKKNNSEIIKMKDFSSFSERAKNDKLLETIRDVFQKNLKLKER